MCVHYLLITDLSLAIDSFHEFYCLVFSFCSMSADFCSHFHIDQDLFRYVRLSFQIFEYFPNFLITNLKTLWSGNIPCMTNYFELIFSVNIFYCTLCGSFENIF
jgi:hypothetical protein